MLCLFADADEEPCTGSSVNRQLNASSIRVTHVHVSERCLCLWQPSANICCGGSDREFDSSCQPHSHA